MVSPGSVRVVFMGTARFSVRSLEALAGGGYQVVAVVSQPPRPAGRGRQLATPPAALAAERLGVPVLHPEKLKAPEPLEQLAGLRPDLIVVAAYAQFLPSSLLKLPPLGCINVHGSLLPRWRGASPIQAAILAGDEFTGVTIITMEPRMDTGPILAQSITRIDESDTAPDLESRLSRAGAALLTSVLPCYLGGSLQPVRQDDGLATYAPIIRKEDGLIDWSQPAVRIWQATRAYTIWPGTFTMWKGRTLRVISCWPGPNAAVPAEAGTVLRLSSAREIGVATGQGVLVLKEVALEGGRPMAARDFAMGHRDFLGSQLG